MGYHRGDVFEEQINLSNIVYKRKGIALIQKIATPVKVLKRTGGRITGFFEQKSTLDYLGVYKNIPIAFDAKETNEKKRFPLKNIHPHQIEFMKEWTENGGRAFVLVSFVNHREVYRLDWKDIEWFWNRYQQNKGKRGYASIPYEHFKLNCKELVSRDGILLDYLEGVEVDEKSNCG
ncbi:Holliday junction resolvase RecU [Clostridium sp. D2Q-14]|uniref:Holliday junction resolvase RecU n=1 Tax=Anaeromonas gelatinilytica TaxID=2683194 RepID=UPI00193C4C28|nr:Holliday junction resolvase RecU [Anaeromonas gelatinilytica]MBS4534786.1 Holliday junction resolvase RecU [Anaeromonas gelatinilytica]